MSLLKGPMPEIIDTVFVKTSPKRSFSMTEYEGFGLVFTNTRVFNTLSKEKGVVNSFSKVKNEGMTKLSTRCIISIISSFKKS
jgi:hypothetical protein